MPHRGFSRLSLCVVAVSLGAAGCGFFGGTQSSAQDQNVPEQSNQSEAAAAGQAQATGGRPSASSGSVPSPAPRQVYASHKTTAGNAPLAVKVFPLSRQGELVTLNFTVVNTYSGPGVQTWHNIEGFFGDGKTEPGAAVDGVYLISGKTAKKYPVARDSSGNCLCTANLDTTDLSKGQALSFSATFAAPPPEVTAVNVHIPHAGTFTNVPIQ